MTLRPALVLVGVVVALSSCEAILEKMMPGPDPEPSTDGGDETDAGQRLPPGGVCMSAVAASQFFQTEGCLGCHAGMSPPDLRLAALPRLINAPSTYRTGRLLVVPGDPGQSELFLRLSGPQPTDYAGSWWMPVGSNRAHENPGAVQRWIAADAELSCDGGVEPPPQVQPVTNPNHYDQATLFTCAQPSAPRSSPARLRRINAREFSVASGTSVGGRFSTANVTSNPLVTGNTSYSSFSEDLSLDGTSLELLVTTLPSAATPWVSRAQGAGNGGRFWTVFDGTPAGFYTTATPSNADRDIWVEALLRQGALFRTPTADERQRVRQLLDAEITAEAGTPFTPAVRSQSLRTVASAARLMAGALFRSELGVDGGTRRRLSDEELGLAVGSVIGAHAVSSTLWGDPPSDAGAAMNPDWSRRRADGRLAEVRDAINDGSIGQKTTITRLLQRYRGGVDPDRLNLMTEYHRSDEYAAQLRQRGEFWLSDGLTRFFREWLDVDAATTHFKDTPNATSRWVTPRSTVESAGFGAVQPHLVSLLDDTIARAVIEAEQSGGDVFRALLTTRTFRVMTNVDGVDTRACTTPADCNDFRVGTCYTRLGFCAAFGTTERNRVFNLATDVADTRAARWVTLPANERSGVLTHPGFLAAHGGNFEDDASLVHRGLWVRENLLCSDVPGLELVSVPAMLQAKGPMLSARDRVRTATEAPGSACLTCHAQMNPYGAPFEFYNHAGFLRADDHGRPPDGSTTITNAPDPALNRTYANPIEFTEALAASPHARRCFVRNVFRSFMGRAETPADACTLSEMEASFAGGSLFKMLETLTTSDTFLYRHDVGVTP